MHPVDKVLIENWFVCCLCLITSRLCCSGAHRQEPRTLKEDLRLGARVGTAGTWAAFPLKGPPPEALWLLAKEQALAFCRQDCPSPPPLPPSPWLVLPQWGQDAAYRLLPPFCPAGDYSSHPILPTPFLPAPVGKISPCLSTLALSLL